MFTAALVCFTCKLTFGSRRLDGSKVERSTEFRSFCSGCHEPADDETAADVEYAAALAWGK